MSFVKRLTLLCPLLLFLFVPYLFAGTTGKIVGTVVEKSTGDPLPGVNILIVGTTIGAATGIDGNFMILNVPPGNYSVRASMIGYKIMTQTDVRVSIDLTTDVDFELDESTIEGEEITVIAKRKIVKKDLTARTAVINSEEIAKAPVEEIEDVLSTQAGVTKDTGGGIHIRGGRTGEVAYWVDGVSVTDAYDGNIAVEVENMAVREMQVISGAFNAEYGQAMSGIINIVTKDGGSEYHGSFSSYFGDYISSHGYDDFEKDGAADDPNKVFMHIGDVDPLAIQNSQASLDGPVPGTGNKLAFYMTGRYFDSDNYMYGKRRFDPQDFSYETAPSVWHIRASGDDEFVPMNPYQKTTAQFKLTSNLIESIKLSYNLMWSKEEFQNYDDFGHDAHQLKYNPDGNLNRFRDGLSNIFKITHTLSRRTYYDFSATFSKSAYQHYVHEDLEDYTVHPDRNQNRPSRSFNVSGENMNRFERSTKTMTLKLDAVSQISMRHQIKTGFEIKWHDLFYEDINVVAARDEIGEILTLGVDEDGNVIIDENGVPTRVSITPVIEGVESNSHDKYEHTPKNFSVYIQDKMEYDDIIANIGVRFDYFDPDAGVLTDPRDPNIYKPIHPDHQEDTLEERLSYWYQDADASYQISPRVGIAYPISESGAVHFSYGHFLQIPKFEHLYTNPEFEMEIGSGVNTLVGNAELEPERTVSYEIGIQQGLTEELGLAVDIYYRDVRNLVGSDRIVSTYRGGEKYAQYINRDYGNIRGVALSLTKRYSNYVSGSIDYTYQIAEGNASNPGDSYYDVSQGDDPEKKLKPLDWDQRHLLNFLMTFSESNNWSLSLLATAGSGFPYTPTDVTIGDVQQNGGRKPPTYNLDVKFNKDFQFRDVYYSFFVNVYNALDRLNENDVHGDTGRASYSLAEYRDNENSEGRVDYVNSISEIYRDPGRYSAPRRVQIGMSVRF